MIAPVLKLPQVKLESVLEPGERETMTRWQALLNETLFPPADDGKVTKEHVEMIDAEVKAWAERIASMAFAQGVAFAHRNPDFKV